ncbi:MAG TPA: CHAT domain-containing tetratricopeptide repeat protein [Bryobacteraceae bacterium]|nr:CHAT domain-containing tetratricopeptide repeat protein [Bryobacteraceae bacterium]
MAGREELERLALEVAGIEDTRARRAFLRANAALHHPLAVEAIYDEAVKLTRVDLARADRLAQAARWLAALLEDPWCRAQSLRATGHVFYARGRYERAIAQYEAALVLLRGLGREVDAGRTLSGALHSLIYLGRYEQALAWAAEARVIFERHGDRLRLARLDINSGNIYYRQDRFEEALALYSRACEELRSMGNSQDVAAVLSNMAVCSISLNDFAGALRYYEEARAWCAEHDMPLLVAEADYNIAYLHYLRGEYVRAIELYRDAREHCRFLDNRYHLALCDLDQSEMYLELNLAEDAAELAASALERFGELGLGYEAAKATAFLAIAMSRQGNTARALGLFADARTGFVRERNAVWPALIDLYQALVLFEADRYQRSGRLARSALRFFSGSPLAGKAALCELLLARLALAAGRPGAALALCRSALDRLRVTETPAVSCHAWFVLGQAREALGERELALEAYRQAHARLEDLRSGLRGEELKIAFMKDKLAVYESLVWMSQSSPEVAFRYIEEAKSRSLADLIAFRLGDLPASSTAPGALVAEARRLREEIASALHRIEAQETRPGEHAGAYVDGLRRRTREIGGRLASTLQELRATDRDFGALQNTGHSDLDEIRAALPQDALLLEYYEARGMLYCCVLGRDGLDLVPLGDAAPARESFRLLRFQLAKFGLGPEYIKAFEEPLRTAAAAHLAELYGTLIAPVRDRLTGSRLVIVPHGFLHYVPFHALGEGECCLVDDFAVSYAPSATVYALCCAKAAAPDGSLILGIPDRLAPHIAGEVDAVAATLPGARLFLGPEATADRLRRYGPESRFVHVATHGLFRQDNPMFSSIRLGDAPLTLHDLYGLRLGAELVTLSGCGTGLNAVVGGDELLGLVRGLLFAGARAVLASLWDVNDESTAEFMRLFYGRLANGSDKAAALGAAMRDLRARYPHPYYWAPFALVGAPFTTVPYI